jgi:hypothetical protein
MFDARALSIMACSNFGSDAVAASFRAGFAHFVVVWAA